MKVTIRQARRSDATAVARLVTEAYEPYVTRIGTRPAPMDDDYSARIEAREVWVAEAANDLAGVLVLVPKPDHLLLDNIATRFRGTGVGAQLLSFAETEARRQGRSEIRLYTNAAMTQNVDYYPRHGYVETHRAVDHGFHRVFFTKTLSE